jgi:hypothetical protein
LFAGFFVSELNSRATASTLPTLEAALSVERAAALGHSAIRPGTPAIAGCAGRDEIFVIVRSTVLNRLEYPRMLADPHKSSVRQREGIAVWGRREPEPPRRHP